MSITLLRTLVAFAEQGSFARAADQLRITQAAVGQRIKKLEEDLKVELVSHERRPPSLTHAGTVLVSKSRDVLAQYDHLMAGFASEDVFSGELTIGALASTLLGMVPEAIRQITDLHPNLQINVASGSSSELPDRVRRSLIDVAVTSEPDILDAQMIWLPLVTEPLILVAAPGTATDDPLKLLRDKPFIRHTTREIVGALAEAWLVENKVTVSSSMEMESLDTLVSMITHDLGISILPDVCVPDKKFSNLTKIPLKGSKIARKLGLLMRVDSVKSNLIKQLQSEILLVVATNSVKYK